MLATQQDVASSRHREFEVRLRGPLDLLRVSDSGSGCQLVIEDLAGPANIGDVTSLGVIGSADLPFDRLGDVIAIERVARSSGPITWRALVVGLDYTLDSQPFPSAMKSVMVWLEIQLNIAANKYTIAQLGLADYPDTDILSGVADASGMVIVDGVRRVVRHSAWKMDPSSPDFPAASSFSDIVLGSSLPEDWLLESISANLAPSVFTFLPAPPAAPGTPVPISSEFTLLDPRFPTKAVRFTAQPTTWSVSLQSLLPVSGYGVAMSDVWAVGGASGLNVILADQGAPVSAIDVRDDTGLLLSSVMIAPDTWTQLPPIPALNARPGRLHSVSLAPGGAGAATFVPTVRYGSPFNPVAGLQLSRGSISSSVRPGFPIQSGAHVRHSLPLGTPIDVICLLGLRNAQGQDPVVQVGPSTWIVDIWNPAVTAITLGVDVPAQRLRTPFGIDVPVPAEAPESVVVIQYAFVMPDSQIVLTDVFGAAVIPDDSSAGASAEQSSVPVGAVVSSKALATAAVSQGGGSIMNILQSAQLREQISAQFQQ
jgi:hypothetical protein